MDIVYIFINLKLNTLRMFVTLVPCKLNKSSYFLYAMNLSDTDIFNFADTYQKELCPLLLFQRFILEAIISHIKGSARFNWY